MEFTFDNNIPIYIQLLDYMKIYLISGVFKSGERLPSVREFATTFKVNPNTMQKALAELESMNLIYTERTNGKYVTLTLTEGSEHDIVLIQTVPILKNTQNLVT